MTASHAADRSVLSQPLTPAEEHAVGLLVEGFERGITYREIAEAMGISKRTAQRHIENAGAKIPGDLPVRLRVVHWYRGGDPVELRVSRP